MSKKETKKVVVVGGGATGWLTALYLNMSLKDVDVTVIESKDIGILGAGEGSVPSLIFLLDYLNIPVSEIIKNCDATIKTGIKFTNWNNDNKYYYHNFSTVEELDFNGQNNNAFGLYTYSALLSDLYYNKTLKNVDFIAKCSEEFKVPFAVNNGKNNDPIFNHNCFGFYSIHFNAVKMAEKLKEIGISRGVKLIDGKIINIGLDTNNNINYLQLENHDNILCDFVFDCSGFARLIIQKTYNSKWKSHSKHLPVNSAVPFFINIDEEIPPYTESIAMKYGWIWKIPLQTRYGCGYVYDSSLATENEIKNEIEEMLGYIPEYPRKDKGPFQFKAGYLEDPWINNCIALGLASGFIEPLEATSIWVTILSLEKVLGGIEWLFLNNKKQREEFNKKFRSINDQVVDFVYMHYMSKRNDTEFWKKFSYNNAPEGLKKKLDIFDYRILNYHDTEGEIWSTISWLAIALGTKNLKNDMSEYYSKYSKAQNKNVKQYDNVVNTHNAVLQNCVKHTNFLKAFK